MLKESQRSANGTSVLLATAGKIAEQVRRLAAYREAQTLFVAPAPILQQVRINACNDGKYLLLPSPGLQEGFWGLAPYSVPFGKIKHAVTLKGIADHGQQLGLDNLASRPVDMLITDALAVDAAGVMVGEGKGFFDLAVAILHEARALSRHCVVVAVTAAFQTATTFDDAEPWDILADVVLHPGAATEMRHEKQAPAIFWDALPHRRIRRMDPLWKLYTGSRLGGAGK